jgi:hypothetical protein
LHAPSTIENVGEPWREYAVFRDGDLVYLTRATESEVRELEAEGFAPVDINVAGGMGVDLPRMRPIRENGSVARRARSKCRWWD